MTNPQLSLTSEVKYLKGVGPAQVWPESLALVGFALVLVTLSVRRFSKTIE